MVAAMRASPSFRDIPVIMMSAAPEAALRKRLDGGYEAFLRKPFRVGALLEAVRSVFERPPAPKPD